MEKILNVKTKTNDYNIYINKGIIQNANKYINLNRKVLILTDSLVPKEYSETVLNQALDGYIYTIKSGESSKCIENVINILKYMIDNNFTRTDCLCAVGGGVCGDMGGFISSIFMRGIDFYNIPTTLLSMVDSSIGGKTAIDFHHVKNVVGAFYPPKCVLIDSNLLKTLDERQFNNGLIEVIKMFVTFSDKLFEQIENEKDIKNNIDYYIINSLQIKKMVVEEDEYEQNIRKALNFGHTIGHALESYYDGLYLHGECVACGMLHVTSGDVKTRIYNVLNKLSTFKYFTLDTQKMIEYIKHDKKASSDYVTVVKCDKIGTFYLDKIKIDLIGDLYE